MTEATTVPRTPDGADVQAIVACVSVDRRRFLVVGGAAASLAAVLAGCAPEDEPSR